MRRFNSVVVKNGAAVAYSSVGTSTRPDPPAGESGAVEIAITSYVCIWCLCFYVPGYLTRSPLIFTDSRIVESQTQTLNVYVYDMYNVYVSIIDVIINMIMFAIRQCAAWASSSTTHTYTFPKRRKQKEIKQISPFTCCSREPNVYVNANLALTAVAVSRSIQFILHERTSPNRKRKYA